MSGIRSQVRVTDIRLLVRCFALSPWRERGLVGDHFWEQCITSSSRAYAHRQTGSLSSDAGEACSAYAACETPNHIERIGAVFADFYRPSVWIKRAAVMERGRTVSVRSGPPNHTLEATAYRTALRLLVRLGLFSLPMRLTSQGCASALIR